MSFQDRARVDRIERDAAAAIELAGQVRGEVVVLGDRIAGLADQLGALHDYAQRLGVRLEAAERRLERREARAVGKGE